MAEQGITITRLRQSFDAWWNGTREYRYDGEQATHAEQLRETQVSLSLMANATDDPDQQRMASDIEDGAEKRLTVLLGKPRLTLEEKRERDAIQAELTKRRQSFAPVDAVEPPQTQVRGFLGPLAPAGMAVSMVRPWMLWTGAIAAVGVWGAYNDVRAGRLENERNEARATVESLEREVMEASVQRDMLADAVRQADELSRATAANLEAERARNARNRALEQRRSRELRQVDAGGPPPAWERSLRDDGLSETGPDSGGGAAPGNS